MKIALTNGGFTATHRRKMRSVEFSEITGVAAQKVGKITYDEVFLIIHSASGDDLGLGELDDGLPT